MTEDIFDKLVSESAVVTANAENETQLRHALEPLLESACLAYNAPWVPYTLEKYIKARGKRRYIDAIHGAVIIEYEYPNSFKGKVGANLKHARKQAVEYAELLCIHEGRPINEYILIVWDGAHIEFGSTDGDSNTWEGLTEFNLGAARRLVQAIESNGRPLVSPVALASHVGPESKVGADLISVFFNAITVAEKSKDITKTQLLFAEWSRLFGQVVGIGDANLKKHIKSQAAQHNTNYTMNTAAYLFALNTVIALVAKVVAARALPGTSEDICDHSTPIHDRIRQLENGSMFLHAGITNMLTGDFFSWYESDLHWGDFTQHIETLIDNLSRFNFDVTKKSARATRDLFKGIYETCVPRELRHALGEFYTPDWLADHGLNQIDWTHKDQLLDPTCGSGTFLLAGLKRRLAALPNKVRLNKLIDGIYGTDLNPLAVLSAKASIAVLLAPFLDEDKPIRLPIYLADAINPCVKNGGNYEHIMPTELGEYRFVLPCFLVEHKDFFQFMSRAQEFIENNYVASQVVKELKIEFSGIKLNPTGWSFVENTLDTVVQLHDREWNGIWCSILADRFAAGAIPQVSHICGNPPWVKWSHLPRDYAKFIKERCKSIGVFSEDTWVGGIESDISTVVTYEAIDRYLDKNGKLGFFITGTVFTNESSEGFRKFSLNNDSAQCRVLRIEDYKNIKPFDGVSNHPVFFIVEKNKAMRYPIPYKIWEKPYSGKAIISSEQDFVQRHTVQNLVAKPVPSVRKGDCRPYIIASRKDQSIFSRVFNQSNPAAYRSRKGVTTDRNGIFWLHVQKSAKSGKLINIRNQANIGRTPGIASVSANVESNYVYPLLRGKDIHPFKASPSLHILVPQRGMHGDPDLIVRSPKTHAFLKRFKEELEGRSSYKRFQKPGGHPYYSLWSTGEYTFSPYKVLWREMAGGNFFAAYCGKVNDPILERHAIVIPDHKLYFISCSTDQEAKFLTGFLNAPIIKSAISAYASQLSLGTSVTEYVSIPKYDSKNKQHIAVKTIASTIISRKKPPTHGDYDLLDQSVKLILQA